MSTNSRPEINSERALAIAILAMRESVKLLAPIADILTLHGLSNLATRTAENKRIDLNQAIDILLDITNKLPASPGLGERCVTCGHRRSRDFMGTRKMRRKRQPVR